MAEPKLPLFFTDDEGHREEYESFEQLAESVEFLDDRESYECIDAAGSRVRIITWGMYPVLAQTVSRHFSRTEIVIEETLLEGNRLLAERFQGDILRTLLSDRQGWSTAYGNRDPQKPATTASKMTAEEFDELWTKVRVQELRDRNA